MLKLPNKSKDQNNSNQKFPTDISKLISYKMNYKKLLLKDKLNSLHLKNQINLNKKCKNTKDCKNKLTNKNNKFLNFPHRKVNKTYQNDNLNKNKKHLIQHDNLSIHYHRV